MNRTEQKQQAFQFIDSHRDEMVSLWQEVVNMEGGPHEKPGIDLVAGRFRQVLDEVGAAIRTVEFAQAGNMLIAELPGPIATPGVLFLGHMDTAIAAGAIARQPFTIRDGKAYGPGVLDMKGGIVAFLYAIKALRAAGYNARPIKVVLAGAEEVRRQDHRQAYMAFGRRRRYRRPPRPDRGERRADPQGRAVHVPDRRQGHAHHGTQGSPRPAR